MKRPGNGSCRGFSSWGEEEEYYHSLSPEDRRRWRIEGHAYFVSFRPENQGKSPTDNWLHAEQEVAEHDTEVRITIAIRKALAAVFHLDESKVSDSTALPQSQEARIRMYGLVMIFANDACIRVTGKSKTAGDLISELCQQTRIADQHTVRFHHIAASRQSSWR